MIFMVFFTSFMTMVCGLLRNTALTLPPVLAPTVSIMTDYGSTTPKQDDLFRRDPGYFDTPNYFVEFDSAKVNKNAPVYLTTTWSYDGAVVDSMTETREIDKLETNGDKLGAWVSPAGANWTPEPWDGKLYHWSVEAEWANRQQVRWSNLLPQWGAIGHWFSYYSPASGITTLGGSGTSTLNFTVSPEPVSSLLFLAGGGLLAFRIRRRK